MVSLQTLVFFLFELLPKEEILFDVICISLVPVVMLNSDVSRYVTYCH